MCLTSCDKVSHEVCATRAKAHILSIEKEDSPLGDGKTLTKQEEVIAGAKFMSSVLNSIDWSGCNSQTLYAKEQALESMQGMLELAEQGFEFPENDKEFEEKEDKTDMEKQYYMLTQQIKRAEGILDREVFNF